MTGKPRATRRDIVFPKGKYTRAARIRAGSGHGSMKDPSWISIHREGYCLSNGNFSDIRFIY